MAQRYGGQFSPDPKPEQGTTAPRNPFNGKRRSRAGGRVNMLFFAPFPLLILAFASPPGAMALRLGAFALLVLAAWLTREGLKAEDAYLSRRIARRPAIPRKLFGSVLTGAGLFVAGMGGGFPLLNDAVFALIGAGLHAFAFGLDPMKDKGAEGIDQFQQDRVARVVEDAEKHLAAMRDAILRAGDRRLLDRVERFQDTARDMFRTVEEDPRDLSAARKYLGVYLQGARDATVKFADIYSRTQDQAARQDYETLLDDLETNFAARTRLLLDDNRTDMEVEIEVLRERLQRDGARH